MSRSVVVLLAVLAAVTALPTGNVEGRTAETLLAQIYQVQEDPSPDASVVSTLKFQITSEIESINITDTTDRLTLPTQLLDAQQHEQSVQKLLINATAEAKASAEKETSIRSRCEHLGLSLDAAKIILDTANASVAQEDEVVAREQIQFQASVESIDRDLQILDLVEKKLRDVVESGSKKAGIEPHALLHQVSVLVQNMRRELEDQKSNAHIEWDLTQKRLELESRPTRNRLESAKVNVTSATGSVTQCDASLSRAHNETIRANESVERLTEELTQAKEAVEGIQIAFDQRHEARVKRIEFLKGVEKKMDELASDADAEETQPTKSA